MKKLHYRKEKFLTVTIYKIHSVSVAIFKKINLKFYFLKGIRVHPKQETEYERNNRLNKEIKRLAAVNGEKPKYRMVAPELLDNIKQSGIQFAYFKKGDKYNIVFLRKNETEIDQLLKQLRKEK